MLRMRVEAAPSARFARSRAVRNAAGLDHVPKQAEIGQVEVHDAAFAIRRS